MDKRALAAFILLGLLPVQTPALAAGTFDGIWAATLVCSQAEDGAKGYTYRFPVEIRNGVLHGEHGTAKTSAWLAVDGTLPPDGSAILFAHGLTGRPDYNVGGVPRQTPYSYHIAVHFDQTHGTGTRTEIRPCTVDFQRS